MVGGCWHPEQQLLKGKHPWLGGRQSNCLQRGPWREEKREKVTEKALEMEPESFGVLGSRGVSLTAHQDQHGRTLLIPFLSLVAGLQAGLLFQDSV